MYLEFDMVCSSDCKVWIYATHVVEIFQGLKCSFIQYLFNILLCVCVGRIADSDEEYDSELDDFIDNGPDEAEDYSKHIKEIFGYDKSR